jgi:hypothetical protein
MTCYKVSKPRKNDWDEYEVRVVKNGRIDEKKTYHTDDKKDAWATYKQMTKWADKKCRKRK